MVLEMVNPLECVMVHKTDHWKALMMEHGTGN